MSNVLNALQVKRTPEKKKLFKVFVEAKPTDAIGDIDTEKKKLQDVIQYRPNMVKIDRRQLLRKVGVVRQKEEKTKKEETKDKTTEKTKYEQPLKPNGKKLKKKKKLDIAHIELEEAPKERSKEGPKEAPKEAPKEEDIEIDITELKPKKTRVPRTKKPIITGSLDDFKLNDVRIEDLLPKREETHVLAKSYYMNNREKFVQFITNLFEPYKDELEDEAEKHSCDRSSNEDFSLLTHQKIVKDYLNVRTPYRGLLLFHGLGSGKTCSSIAIIEGLQYDKKVIIMTPASLRRNYMDQIKFCGTKLFRRNQHWTFVSTTINPKMKDVLSKILNINTRFIQKHNGAFMINANKKSNFDDLTSEQKKILDEQLDIMIQTKYQFINYNGLRKEKLEKMTKSNTKNPFDDAVVIVDEVHNLISRITNKLNKPESLANQLYELLMSANNTRLVFLTGTPMINYPNELGIVFNMLRGYIKTFSFTLNVKTTSKVDLKIIQDIFKKYALIDYIEYSSSSKTLTVTKNPFGFVNYRKKDRNDYFGVSYNEKGEINEEKFIKFIIKKLNENNIEAIPRSGSGQLYKALPDRLDDFKSYFINNEGTIKNPNLFKRRILGLTSYFRDIEELMPEYNESKDLQVLSIPMSDYQFGIYEIARQAERAQEMKNAKKRKKQSLVDGIYSDTVSTYRIFSRAFCNFVFPKEMKRPMPLDDIDVKNEKDMSKLQGLNEEDFDGIDIEEQIKDDESVYTPEDRDELAETKKDKIDDTYPRRIQKALEFLKENADTYLTPSALETYSPKFKEVLENIKETIGNEEKKGLHLIYSQFRTLEGIGILKLILEHNGFTQFKIKKSSTGNWELDIPMEERGKPTFILYTGTETPEEKEIVRNIYNSEWNKVPNSIIKDIQPISKNNHFGKIIQIIMITASGAEGVNLKNTRYVHLIEPYWHPVRTEQVIGRARRICSHNDLPEKYRNIQVILYTMTFTEEQKTGDESIELRLKDIGKVDKTTPLTSDEALFEISTLKQNISRQLLKSVKESAMDCVIHSKPTDKEPLRCFTFGDVSSKSYSFKPNYANEQNDKVADINIESIQWSGKEFTLKGKKYVLRMDGNKRTDKVYDYNSYIMARSNPGYAPIYVGKLVIKKKDGKQVGEIIRD